MIIKVKAKPNSREECIEKLSDSEYLISVKQPAEDGKANTRIINLLAKELGISYRKMKIKNPKSRDKLIYISD